MPATTNPPPASEPASQSESGRGKSPSEENPAAAAFHHIPHLLAELKAYFQYFVAAKTDVYKAKIRRLVMLAAVGVLALIIAGSVLATAVLLVMWGLARGLGRLMWGQYWAGELIVGLLVLGGTFLAVWLMVRRLTHASRVRTEQKYEQQRARQRVNLGYDVHDRATGH